MVSSSEKKKEKKTEEATSDTATPAASFIGVKGKASKGAGTSSRAVSSTDVEAEEPGGVWEVNSEDEM